MIQNDDQLKIQSLKRGYIFVAQAKKNIIILLEVVFTLYPTLQQPLKRLQNFQLNWTFNDNKESQTYKCH